MCFSIFVSHAFLMLFSRSARAFPCLCSCGLFVFFSKNFFVVCVSQVFFSCVLYGVHLLVLCVSLVLSHVLLMCFSSCSFVVLMCFYMFLVFSHVCLFVSMLFLMFLCVFIFVYVCSLANSPFPCFS